MQAADSESTARSPYLDLVASADPAPLLHRLRA